MIEVLAEDLENESEAVLSVGDEKIRDQGMCVAA